MKKSTTYNVSGKFTHVETNTEHNFQTQLYKVGIYIIFNGNPSRQASTSPERIKKLISDLKKAESKGEIKDLFFGREIKATKDEHGFYVEVTE